MNWKYTTILHGPRKALNITVLEYTVLDYVYKTQTHPEHSANGWARTGCHKIAQALDISSGTVKNIFDRMDNMGLLERVGSDLKKVTPKFYEIAYEEDVQKLNGQEKPKRPVQKLNGRCSEIERAGVQKLNGNRSEIERYISKEIKDLNINKGKDSFASEPAPLPEYEPVYFADEIGEVDETQVIIVSLPDFEKEKEKSCAKKEKEIPGPGPAPAPKTAPTKTRKKAANPDPAPTAEMWDRYAQEYQSLTGAKPAGQARDFANLAQLYKVVRPLVESATYPGDTPDVKGAVLEYITEARAVAEKDKWLKNNYTPGVLLSQFNSLQSRIRQKKTSAYTAEDIIRIAASVDLDSF